MEHPFSWYDVLPAGWRLLVPQHLFFAGCVLALLVPLGLWVSVAHRRAQDPGIPDAGISLRNLAELVVEFIVWLSDSIIGHGGRKYVSLFGTFFLFILLSNLLGLVPGFLPPTSNLNVTLGLGLVSFAAYNVFGFRAHGVGYLKHFMGPMTHLPSTRRKILSLLFLPVLVLSVLFFFILESSSHLFRPVSLAVRLFGNMMGDHQVIEVFTDLSKVFVPVLFYVLGAVVAVVQAFVFTVLTVVYVALAVSHEH